jgi:hypothetical protein
MQGRISPSGANELFAIETLDALLTLPLLRNNSRFKEPSRKKTYLARNSDRTVAKDITIIAILENSKQSYENINMF